MARTSTVLRSHHGYREHQDTGSSSITLLLHCTVQALRLLHNKQARAFTHTGYPQRFTLALTPLVSHSTVTRSHHGYREHYAQGRPCTLLLVLGRSVLLFAFLFPPIVGHKSATIRPSLTQGHSFVLPLRGKKDALRAAISIARPPPTRGRWPVGRPRLPPSPGFATLRSVLRG